MKDKLSSVCLACFVLFLLLAFFRAGDRSDLYMRWLVYAVVAAVFGVATVLLRRSIRRDAEREKARVLAQEENEKIFRGLAEDKNFTMKILSAEQTEKPGRFVCDVEIVENDLHQSEV